MLASQLILLWLSTVAQNMEKSFAAVCVEFPVHTGTGLFITNLIQGEAAIVKETLTTACKEWSGRTGIMT